MAALLVIPASAQSPEERRQIDAFRDSLQLVTDTMVLRERERLLLRSATGSRRDPFFHLYLGSLAFRQGELGGVAHLDEAAAEFRWAANLASQWSYAWSALGTTELELAGRLERTRLLNGRRTRLARESYSRASLALARAVTLEPEFAGRLVLRAQRSLREGLREQAIAVREGLRRAGSPNPQVLLALGRVERQLGDSAALATFSRYLGSGGNRNLGALELARTQLLRGDLTGASRYYAAAAHDDPAVLDQLRGDLSPIANDAELAGLEQHQGTTRAVWLRRFWSTRDRIELHRDGERLAEHLRRLATARTDFLVEAGDRAQRLDDRGNIYVRHGEPDERARFAAPGVEPNESWIYRRRLGEAGLILHFVARRSPNDFQLVESLQDIASVRRAAELFRSRARLDSMFRGVPESDGIGEWLRREREAGRQSIRIASHSDSYPWYSGVPLDGWGAVLIAGATRASPVLQVVFVVPRPIEAGAIGREEPLRVRFAALDTTGSVVASVDSVLPSNDASSAVLAVPVRAGRLIVHAGLEVGDGRSIDLGIDTLTVPSPGARELRLGDLLVGSASNGIPIPIVDGSDFRLAPHGVVSRNQALELGAAVFGLSPEETARIEVKIAPAQQPNRWRAYPDRRARGSISRTIGTGPVLPLHLRLDLKDLEAGRWLVALIVTSESGAAARSEAVLLVQEP